MGKNIIEVTVFNTGNIESYKPEADATGHGGGDSGIMRDFISSVRTDGKVEGLTSAKVLVQSHVIAFAAEKARLENKVINIPEYVNKLKLDIE